MGEIMKLFIRLRGVYRIMSEEDLATAWRIFKIWLIKKYLPSGYILFETKPPVSPGKGSRIRGIA